ACQQAGGRYCGKIGDGCGKTLDCGDCTSGLTCGGGGTPGVCGAAAGACTPLSCQQPGGQYCGKIGDGCGKALDCGACPAGQTCGGAGTANVCAPSSCTALSCIQPSGNYCGDVGDSCGKILHCGTCPSGQLCGALAPGTCG